MRNNRSKVSTEKCLSRLSGGRDDDCDNDNVGYMMMMLVMIVMLIMFVMMRIMFVMMIMMMMLVMMMMMLVMIFELGDGSAEHKSDDRHLRHTLLATG